MANLQTEEELLTKQKRELKELQGKIQNIKHSIPKGDKKRKKEATAEIALLEAELTAKHEKELKELLNINGEKGESSQKDEEIMDDVGIDKLPDESSLPSSAKKISKAQKRRNKKADKVKEREEAIGQQEITNLSGARNIEKEKLDTILSERGLSIHEVPSDGDCLYKAVEHQLSVLNLQEISVKQLRQATSEYMLSHKDDFGAFLTYPATGDVMTEEQYEKYCQDIAAKPTWGGQVEIQALSEVCKVPIEVIQADGPSITTGERKDQAPIKLILSYHRHMYGLGEHYNSVVPRTDVEDS